MIDLENMMQLNQISLLYGLILAGFVLLFYEQWRSSWQRPFPTPQQRIKPDIGNPQLIALTRPVRKYRSLASNGADSTQFLLAPSGILYSLFKSEG